MFSALKKLVGSEQAPGRDKNIPAGLQSMNQALQRRFAKGVQYNSECGGPGRRGGGGVGAARGSPSSGPAPGAARWASISSARPSGGALGPPDALRVGARARGQVERPGRGRGLAAPEARAVSQPRAPARVSPAALCSGAGRRRPDWPGCPVRGDYIKPGRARRPGAPHPRRSTVANPAGPAFSRDFSLLTSD
ncbi:hypothetical protein P7K49_002121 [Saguinus oedipus]|uniref:Uncharacterized protein n=1 Tax=Saguinus oedipus TaxID=9490 RepID=A0ABQ9WH09_SAGOE|nr:hypothetical protein P7K49_002121 [Saguinus oedipus]